MAEDHGGDDLRVKVFTVALEWQADEDFHFTTVVTNSKEH